ncbi:MAG: hypothetical protein WBM04_20820 [Candidatus Korobacteraceae bacterium]
MNFSLASAAQAARLTLASGLYNRTVTAATLAAAKSYNAALVSMLHSGVVSETYRAMNAVNYLAQTGPTPGQINIATQYAQENGIPPTILVDMTYNGEPLNPGTMEQQILALQEVNGMDNLYSLTNDALQNVTYVGGGQCSWYNGDAYALQHSADLAIAFGTFLTVVVAPLSGPLAPAVAACGTVELGGGAMFWMMAEMCIQ